MGLLRRNNKRVPGEYPERFTKAFMRQTLPTATPSEARSAVNHLRAKGWSEEKLAQYVLPYMPPERPPEQAWPVAAAQTRPVAAPAPLPDHVSQEWLDAQLPALEPRQITAVVEQLEQRGWSPREAAIAVLPHLLPKLPRDDVRSILAGLTRIGMSPDEVDRLRRGH